MKSFLRLCRDLLFVPICAGCGKRLPPEMGEDAVLCPRCALLWERELRHRCDACGQSYFSCLCAPSQLTKAGCTALIKLAPYREEGDSPVVRRMILRIKRHPRSAAFSYVAGELSHGVLEWINARQDGRECPTVITFLPRTKQRVRQLGFDQAELLAKQLSVKTGIPVLPLIKRVRGGKQQKSLHAAERRENVKGAFRTVGEPAGLRVLVVDDLATTGAGLAEVTRLLYRAGAAEVCGAVIAATPRAAKRAGVPKRLDKKAEPC